MYLPACMLLHLHGVALRTRHRRRSHPLRYPARPSPDHPRHWLHGVTDMSIRLTSVWQHVCQGAQQVFQCPAVPSHDRGEGHHFARLPTGPGGPGGGQGGPKMAIFGPPPGTPQKPRFWAIFGPLAGGAKNRPKMAISGQNFGPGKRRPPSIFVEKN